MHRSQLSMSRTCVSASEIALGSQLKKEREKVAAYYDRRRVYGAFPSLSYPLILHTRRRAGVPLHYWSSFHNDGLVSAAVALGACAYS